MQNTKMDGKSLNPQEELLELLKQKFPAVFAEGYVDCQKLKQTLGEDVDLENERYGMTWAGKNNCFRVIQEATTATLKPARDESVDFDETENLFIEGDNLEVLKILQKPYYGKVKMIYIDPPYNTGNDFIYNDDFKQNKAEYEEKAGIKDGNGDLRSEGLMKNTRDRGHYHSDWLNMMYPRLFLARNLLRQDGVIFVSIDDNEVHNLRMIMNEIFGEENFVAQIVWQKKYAASNDAKGIPAMHDYIITYQRSEQFNRNLFPRTEKQNKLYKHDDGDGKGLWRSDNLLVKSFSESYVFPIKNPNTGEDFLPPKGSCWRANSETIKKWLSENRIFFGKDRKGAPQLKRYLNEVQQGIVPTTWWPFSEAGHNDEANKELKSLFKEKAPFDTPKPTRLVKRILTLATEKDEEDIVVDFFAGSGSTAHAVMELNKADRGNRKCISIQLPELCEEKSEAYKAGYKTIADIAKERIRRAGKKITPPNLLLLGEEISSLSEEEVSNPPDQGDLGGFIPYNTALKERARKLQKNMTVAEKKIWNEVLSRKQFENLKFLRQKPLDNFIVDFYCSKLLLVIEIDGDSHAEQLEYDEERTKKLEKFGIKVIRYTNDEIMNNISGVYDDLLIRIKNRQKLFADHKKHKLDTGFKVFKLDESNFKIWRTDVKDEKSLLKQMSIFVDNVKEESTQDNILYELILKSGLDLNVEVAKKEADKKTYFLVDEGKLIICLEDKITQALLDAILAEKPEKVICLDKAFGGNDQLKTNILLQLESAKIDFKVI